MRDLERNKQKIWYCKYLDKVPIKDLDGFDTGEFTDKYTNPKEFRINVYATAGNSRQNAFGYNLEYSRTMVTCDKRLDLSEGDYVFVDVIPKLNADGSLELGADGTPVTPPDYYVTAVGYSQNTTDTTYALAKKE